MSIRSESPISNMYTYDTELELKDAYLVASSAAAEVDDSAQIIDLGSGRVRGDVVIDLTAIEIASDDEVYDIVCQFSDSATFASGVVNGSSLNLGATEVTDGGAGDATTGRYILPFTNLINDSQYRYMRLYTVVAGTIATGINYTAFIGKPNTMAG